MSHAEPDHDESANLIALEVLEKLCDALQGPRLSPKELLVRTVALLSLRGHWRFHGMTEEEIATRFSISRRALCRMKTTLPLELNAQMERLRAQSRSAHPARGKTRRKCPQNAKG